MAINLNQQDPNNPQGNQGQQPGQPQQQGQGFKPRTTGFTNLQRVLDANKNNKLGETVGQGVQNITNKTQGQTQTAQNNFAKDIGSAVNDVKSGQKIQQNLSNLDFATNANEAANKIQEVGGDEYVNAAKNLRGGYQGPQGLQNEDQLQSQAQQLGQTANGLLTSSGRQAALQRFVNAGPNYTQGKQQLDNMLLGQNPEAIREARRSAAQTAEGTNDAIRQANQQGQFIGQQFNSIGQDIGNKAQGLGSNLQSTLTAQAAAKNADSVQKLADFKQGLANGTVTPEQYDFLVKNVLGGTENTYNLTKDQLAGMVSAKTDYNTSNVANQGEVNARDALARLSGIQDPNSLVSLDASQVGKIDPSMIANNQGYQSQVAAADAAKNAAVYGTLNRVRNGGSDADIGHGTFFDTTNPYNNGKPLSYDETTKMFNVQQAVNSGALTPQQGLRQLSDAGIFNADVENYGQNPFNQEGYFSAIRQAYGNTNQQYGIGNNLRALLAGNPNNKYGVT